jgi:hypothetical protein
MSLKKELIQIIVIVLLISQFPIIAYGNEKDLENIKTIQKIEKQDPAKLRVERLNQKSEYWKGDIGVIIDQNKKKIQVKNIQKGTVSIGIADIGKATISTTEGQVIYISDKVDVVVQGIEGGIRQVINIKNNEAPTAYNFPIEIQKGYSFKLNNKGGVDIINNKGQIESAILSPWAKDAEGKDIKTWYTLDRNILTQHIDTTNAIHPILADPVYCSQYVSWSGWIRRGSEESLSIIPTSCARAWGGDNLSGGFLEVHTKSGRRWSGSRYNSMFNQYRCHVDIAPLKDRWNLEEFRPNVGYIRTLAALCNP